MAVELGDPEGGPADRARRVPEALDGVLGRDSGGVLLWPHVTVLRLRRPARLGSLEDLRRREQVFDVGRGALYDSHQSPGGPSRYRELAAVEFAPVP